MNKNEAFDIMHGEERRMEIQDVKSAQRDEKIGVLTKEYYKDVGTFFEWIQSIEIGEDDSQWYKRLHHNIIFNYHPQAGETISCLYAEHCEEKATEEIDDE